MLKRHSTFIRSQCCLLFKGFCYVVFLLQCPLPNTKGIKDLHRGFNTFMKHMQLSNHSSPRHCCTTVGDSNPNRGRGRGSERERQGLCEALQHHIQGFTGELAFSFRFDFLFLNARPLHCQKNGRPFTAMFCLGVSVGLSVSNHNHVL